VTRRPARIGLTGGIGSGKSLVAGLLRELGAAVIDADVIAREVVAPGGPAYEAVVRAFGREMVGAGGRLDRRALAARIFADPAARRRLNALTHPHIRRRMQEDAARIAAGGRAEVIVFDIPLLLDTTDGRDLDLDGVLVVDASEDVRVARVAARDGLSEAEVRRRLAAQRPLAEKVAEADWVITNNGSPDDTRRQVLALWPLLRRA
jgi:dephospho-CoA kinase